jgi:hypothetical protein
MVNVSVRDLPVWSGCRDLNPGPLAPKAITRGQSRSPQAGYSETRNRNRHGLSAGEFR